MFDILFIHYIRAPTLSPNTHTVKQEQDMEQTAHNILVVSSSARQQSSVTRRFSDELIDSLKTLHSDMRIQTRDTSKGIPFIDEQWVNANFTPAEERSAVQLDTLSYSDKLVAELQQADSIIIASPIYNFSVPASLKAWIDQIARAGLTFNYTENGPVGKLKNKKAYIVMASGGTELGSEIDFASTYLKHVLGFIGIHDVSIISAEKFNANDDISLQRISAEIKQVTRQAA